jgi:DNA-directed RNA polymerase subunit L
MTGRSSVASAHGKSTARPQRAKEGSARKGSGDPGLEGSGTGGVIMAVHVLRKEKDVIELELEDIDQSLAQILAEKLNEDKDVEFAAFKVEHPLIGKPRIYLKTRKGDPAKLIESKLEMIRKEVQEFRQKFLEIVK